ncbi:MAG TPA: M23 family metallopeptidase, partial [Actinomycetota bacterium]
MFAPKGTPAVAAADATVTERLESPAMCGLGVEITDSSHVAYLYCHLSGFAPGLHVGTRVSTGDVVGYVGNTGDASGGPTHLHFQVQPFGVPEPPMPIVDRWLARSEARALALVAATKGVALEPRAGGNGLAEGNLQDGSFEGAMAPVARAFALTGVVSPIDQSQPALVAFLAVLFVLGRRLRWRRGAMVGSSANARRSLRQPPPGAIGRSFLLASSVSATGRVG